MAENRWLLVEEITQYLGASKETIYRWLHCGSIPSPRIGKLWKFRPTEVDEWVTSGKAGDRETSKVGPTAEPVGSL